MKKKRLTLTVLLLLLALAGALLALLGLYNERAEQAASEAAEGTISLSHFAVSELTRLEYSYGGETVTLDYDGESWTLDGDPAYHLDQSKCDTMAAALADLKAKRQLTAEEGEDYGLSTPLLTVSVTAAGETATFVFGDTNSVTGDIYLQKEGDSAVYTASSAKAGCFEYGKAELFGAFNPAGITASSLESIYYTNTAGGTPFSVSLQSVSVAAEGSGDGGADNEAADSDNADSEDGSSAAEYTTAWRLAGEPDSALDEDAVQAILSALGGYVTGQRTDANPSQYGFDAPAVTVTASDGEADYTLYYAVGTDGYYMMVEGDSSVYTVDGSSLEAFGLTGEQLKAAA